MSTSNFTEGGSADASSSAHAGISTMTARASIGPFDIKSPPVKKHKVAGHMVPTFRSATRFINVKRRRVSIVILHPALLQPGQTAPDSSALPWDPDNEILQDDDRVLVRFFSLSRKPKPGEIETKDSGDGEDDDGKFRLRNCIYGVTDPNAYSHL
jgi:hypothetical protein